MYGSSSASSSSAYSQDPTSSSHLNSLIQPSHHMQAPHHLHQQHHVHHHHHSANPTSMHSLHGYMANSSHIHVPQVHSELIYQNSQIKCKLSIFLFV